MPTQDYDSTEGMSPLCKTALRNMLLACADTKLLLGYHYGEWTFGTPEIEAAIACCSLCQSELGHVRLLHAILNKHYGEDADELMESRQPNEFANIVFLDNEIKDWAEMVAVNYVVDLAVTTLLHSMRESSFKPLHMSLEKMLQEERYHIHHGQGWFRTLSKKSEETKSAITQSAGRALREVVAWFGPPDSEEDAALVNAGIKNRSNAAILQDFLNEVGVLADSLDVHLILSKTADDHWETKDSLDWNGWNPQSRRIDDSSPDEQILYHLRGSKNKVFKLT
ncbi:MAG: Phenylacetic acid catabolic protein [bacterium]